MKLYPLKSRLEALTGFKKYAAAFGLGAAMTLSMPPVGAFYVLLLCVPGIIWLTRACATRWSALLTGWAFGSGYFIFGLYWVSVALFVDIKAFWWVLPVSAVLGPAALALFYAFIPLVAWRYRAQEAAYALMIVAAWAAVEWLRGHVFTGFPWNLPGYTWEYLLPVMQVNAVVGIYGLTLLTLLWASMPALPRKFVPFVMASFVLLGAAGMARLYLHPVQQTSDFAVRIVQPNIQQSIKWSAEDMWHNFQHQLELTALPPQLKQPLTFVIWPETAVMTDQGKFPDIAGYIAAHLPVSSLAIFGGLVIDDHKFYNSMIVLNKKAQIVAAYNKHHLVPFGEYVPYRKYLKMTPIAAGIAQVGDFTRGDGLATLQLGQGLPKPSPLICYEAIFPGDVARVDLRPDWLVNITNDAWYGSTAGPHQHFQNVRVRAIEEGLPLVRVANTGISATIDPLGRIIGMKALGETGIIDTILPTPLPPTVYARFGDRPFVLMLVLLFISGETLRRKRNKN